MEFGNQTHQRPPDRRGDPTDPLVLVAGMITTVLLHGVIVGLVIWGTSRSDQQMEEKTEEKMLKFEDVDLLKMGEQKPDNQLPRKSNPPTPAPEQETVALNKDEKKEPENKEEPKEKTQKNVEKKTDETSKDEETEDREREMNEAFESLQNPNRPTNTDVPEGSEKGVASGSISDEALANLMGTFQAKLLEKLGQHWRVPTTISDEALKKLFGQVVVYVRLSKSGHVVTYRFKKRSPNEQFNSSIERLLKKFQASGGGKSLPLPEDEKVRQTVLQQGLNLKNWEVTQQ